MLELFTLLLMIGIAAVGVRAGIFRAAVLFINVLLAGFLAFNFWEPLARSLGTISEALDAAADAMSLVFLLTVFLGLLHFGTKRTAPKELSFPPVVRRAGGAAFGLLAGYFLAAFILCMLQTLPLPERFLGYDPARGLGLGSPDRVWLAMMHRASGRVFDDLDADWFDADGSFSARYARYRRHAPDRRAQRNEGEFPAVLSTKRVTSEESGNQAP